MVDVALETVFNKLKARHKEAVDKERSRRQEESDETERQRLAEEKAREEKKKAEEKSRIKAEQDETKGKIMGILEGGKNPVVFATTEFADLDGGANASLGTVGGSVGEVMFTV